MKNIELQILFDLFSKLITGSPPRTFWEWIKNQITNLISLFSKLTGSPARTFVNTQKIELQIKFRQ
jgi:hypothetical protein